MPTKKRLAALLLPLSLLAAQPAAAEAAKLKRGIYDCMAYNYVTGWLDYKGSVKLLPERRYQHAWGRKGRKFEDPTKGKYMIRGRKVKFRGGAMSKTPGRIAKRTQFDVLVDGERSGISCYYVTNP